jgi:nitroimidazol reductase NimA-like FMN-containing flavoprotein (pyridoxamine 5'-phosphate oxidase superfamily)
MTVEDREAFLAEAHLGVISVADDAGRAPLAVPIWYAYQPGEDVSFITARDSRKAELIRKAGRVSLCVQTADYRYVSVEGPVVSIQDSITVDERPVTVRARSWGRHRRSAPRVRSAARF